MKKITLFLIAMLFAIPLFAKTYTLQEALDDASSAMQKKLDGKVNTVAVMDIQTEYAELNDYMCSELTHNFVISFEQTVVAERNDSALKTIKKELNYQNSGEVSDSTIQSVGNSLGADCIVLGDLKEVSNGYQLNLKAVHVETKKVFASWKGMIKKNDKNIQFQIKKSAYSEKPVKKQLIEPGIKPSDLVIQGKQLKPVVSMLNSNLSYSDIVEIFIQRFGIEYVSNETYVASTAFFYETSKDLEKRKGELAWCVYATDDNAYTLLVTNVGKVLLSRYYEDGLMYGSESEYFWFTFPDFLFQVAINLKSAGKSFSYEELVALNNVLLGFENSSYYKDYDKDSRPNLIDSAAMNYNTQGHGVSSKTFIEMCVKAGFDNGYYGPLLHQAAEMDTDESGPELTKLLIDLGVDLNKTDEDGVTALIYAIEVFDISDGAKKSAELLIKAGADVNIKDDNGSTALIHAVENDASGSFLKLLITNGANVNEINDLGETALSIAQDNGNASAVRILKQAGAIEVEKEY